MPEERQHIVHVRGSRRAQLTPAPDTISESQAEKLLETTAAPVLDKQASEASGPNDERMRLDVPPHY